MISNSNESEALDFHRSSQILLRHGFFINTGAPSPMGPIVDANDGLVDGHLRCEPTTKRRVSWNLSEAANHFPLMPLSPNQDSLQIQASLPKLPRRDTFTGMCNGSDSDADDDHNHIVRSNACGHDYVLGDVIRSSSHMMIECNTDRAIKAVDSLQIHDFAWVKRSDGLFTYAILAYRASINNESNHNRHPTEYMYFVVDDSGSTKMVVKKHWHDSVRRVKPNHCSRIIDSSINIININQERRGV